MMIARTRSWSADTLENKILHSLRFTSSITMVALRVCEDSRLLSHVGLGPMEGPGMYKVLHNSDASWQACHTVLDFPIPDSPAMNSTLSVDGGCLKWSAI